MAGPGDDDDEVPIGDPPDDEVADDDWDEDDEDDDDDEEPLQASLLRRSIANARPVTAQWTRRRREQCRRERRPTGASASIPDL